MKEYLTFVILISLFSCKTYHNQEDLGFKHELKKTFIEGPSREDCLEEISKLEDRYLKNVKNLKGYTWNEDVFKASIEISDFKKLKISLIPSGNECDFVLGIVAFTVSKEFSYHENKTEIIDDFIWVSKLLRNEKEFRTVEKILNEKKDALIGSYQDDKFISLFPEIDEDGVEIDNEYLQTFMAYFEKELNTSKYTILYFFK